MKILWLKTDFLHPTTRGGQIRTLEMLKRLHRQHEVHYVALDTGEAPEGPARAGEYSTQHYAIPHHVASAKAPGVLLKGLVDPLPVAAFRYRSEAMREEITQLSQKIQFDSIVCDFLFPAPNVPDLKPCVLFQHNVEAMIWKRHAEHGATPLHRWYFRRQYERMCAFEKHVCQSVRRVVAVSPADADYFKTEYGLREVPTVATGVDLEYFAPPAERGPSLADLVFVGSMDWMPNIDGMRWFQTDVLPLIWAQRPETVVAVVGRKPGEELIAWAAREPRVKITGTVPDVRPWLHGGRVSIVPLRIGGGTRLKIYEAMAARVPVVSTTVGAEGLDIHDGVDIRLADTAADFANACLQLLRDASEQQRMAEAAWSMVAQHYSWDAVTSGFAEMLAT